METGVSEPTFNQKRMQYAGRMSIGAIIASVLLATLLLTGQENVRWFAENFVEADRSISVSGVCTLLILLIVPVISLTGYRLFSHEDELLTDVEKIIERGRQYWLGRLAVSFVITFALGLLTMLLFYLVEQMFTNAVISVIAGILVATLYGGAASFAVGWYICGLGEQQLMRLIAAIFILGLFASFLITQEDEWWRNSISFLGHAPGSSLVFNVMIVCVGLVTLTLVRDVLDDLSVLVNAEKFPINGYVMLRYGLVSVAVLIMGVGLYPTAINPISDFLHDFSAHALSLLLVLGMFLIRWIVPGVYPGNFIRTSLVIGLFCVLLFVAHFGFLFLNFVAFELILFAAFAVWMYLFLQETKSYIRRQDVREMQSIIAQNVKARG